MKGKPNNFFHTCHRKSISWLQKWISCQYFQRPESSNPLPSWEALYNQLFTVLCRKESCFSQRLFLTLDTGFLAFSPTSISRRPEKQNASSALQGTSGLDWFQCKGGLDKIVSTQCVCVSNDQAVIFIYFFLTMMEKWSGSWILKSPRNGRVCSEIGCVNVESNINMGTPLLCLSLASLLFMDSLKCSQAVCESNWIIFSPCLFITYIYILPNSQDSRWCTIITAHGKQQ